MGTDAPGIEREIIAQIRAAKIRLRRDKVVLGLMVTVQASLANVVADGEVVIFTLTAPIRQPAKTAAELETVVRESEPDVDNFQVIFGNNVCVRRLSDVRAKMPKVLGFVHNAASDAGRIMALAEARLSK
jgi:hypothetical protein